jgi:hypothetical protein
MPVQDDINPHLADTGHEQDGKLISNSPRRHTQEE